MYALTVAKGGPKLTKSLGNPNGPPNDNFSTSAYMKETNTTMGEYAKAMQYVLDRPVVDQTGLKGRWDFLLKWTPDESQFTAIGAKIPAADGRSQCAAGTVYGYPGADWTEAGCGEGAGGCDCDRQGGSAERELGCAKTEADSLRE